jgi:ABC-type lipoprotein release transport system permease subunit
VAQVETGDLSQEMFRISGIYYFNIQEMDRLMAFARLSKAQEMLGIGNEAHEIAIKFVHSEFGRDKNLSFWDKYSQNGNEAVGWTTLLPQLEAVFELSQFSTLITALILFGVVALGIINTLFMSIHERMFEFGVIRAVGTRPFNVSRLIFFEAASLAVLSIILGNILGFLITFITSRIGIDYTGIEFVGVTFRELLYPKITLTQFIIYPIWVFIFTLIAGIYPAIYAARMSPAQALHKSM